ncbi:hypothetical protein T07_7706 [Trichinella nelsoni]|uniref:Uncharacterized protein n=1 Tax=Trichinella nelsoni TaxID=6336 RepID=A0A0V0RC86_9BILA|nr:hypothetical protein T07_7706 [Trichinella nelsoni]
MSRQLLYNYLLTNIGLTAALDTIKQRPSVGQFHGSTFVSFLITSMPFLR